MSYERYHRMMWLEHERAVGIAAERSPRVPTRLVTLPNGESVWLRSYTDHPPATAAPPGPGVDEWDVETSEIVNRDD